MKSNRKQIDIKQKCTNSFRNPIEIKQKSNINQIEIKYKIMKSNRNQAGIKSESNRICEYNKNARNPIEIKQTSCGI